MPPKLNSGRMFVIVKVLNGKKKKTTNKAPKAPKKTAAKKPEFKKMANVSKVIKIE